MYESASDKRLNTRNFNEYNCMKENKNADNERHFFIQELNP